ncbi:hypothetical protein JXO59_02180, partial [candidate division KSB1 bacterium]|nr:hypothetical protein [candidate division KSB1 bacterium]
MISAKAQGEGVQINGHGSQTRGNRILHGLLLFSALLYFVFFIAVALTRLTYPYALEWAEGGMLDHVHRILLGQPLYVAPSMAFTPYTYTPLYFYLAAGLAKFLGTSFIPLRLISLLAALACFYLIGLFVHRETGSRSTAFLSAALFAATFQISGAFFDIGRVDSLLLFFLLWGFYLFRFRQGAWAMVAAVLLFFTAFWIKQTA